MPWEAFSKWMRRSLRPPTDATSQAGAFWREWRLGALDGIQFSRSNTPQTRAHVRKARSRRGRAAFATITTGVLLEAGLHNPLAAAIGARGRSEWALALELLAHLPADALLLADRLHRCAAFATAAAAACGPVGSHSLIRARANVRGQVVRRFKDGSRRVRVPGRAKGRPGEVLPWLEVREIRVRVQRTGHRGQELRLWTTLLDPGSAPAQDLVALVARRWEHELYYREMKHPLRKGVMR